MGNLLLLGAGLASSNIPAFPSTYAYYRFQNNGNDSSGNVRNLTMIDANYGTGLIGEGLIEGGGQITTYSIPNQCTISGWFNTDTIGEGGGPRISIRKNSNNVRIIAGLDYNLIEYSIIITISTDSGTQNISIPVPSNSWVHYASTRNNQSVLVYINGELSVTVNNATLSTFDLLFVTTNGGDDLFGAIDELGIWDITLTESDILQLYNNGAGYDPTI